MTTDTIAILPCNWEFKGDCAGEVEYRIPMSASGKSFPYCEKHFDARLDEQERISRTYDIPMFYDTLPPEDFWD